MLNVYVCSNLQKNGLILDSNRELPFPLTRIIPVDQLAVVVMIELVEDKFKNLKNNFKHG